MNHMRGVLRNSIGSIINKVDRMSLISPIYHPGRMNRLFKPIHCYDGLYHSGAVCFETYKELKDNSIDCKVMKTKIDHGAYLNYHTYILVNGKIVDPTFKQFMRDHRGINDKFQTELYEGLEPEFVGDKEELLDIYNNLINLNKETYGKSITTFNSIKNIWDNPVDITEQFKHI